MKRTVSLLTALLLLLLSALPVMADTSAARIETTAVVEKIQKYGNVTLEATCESAFAAGFDYGDVVTVSFPGKKMDMPFCANYSDVDSGTCAVFARKDDTNLLVAINMGDFATKNGIATKETFADKTFKWSAAEGVTDPVAFTITLKTKGGYYDEYVMHQLSYTNNREDYPVLSDEQFANFREIRTSGMAAGKLYRSASPVDPENNRNTYADAAIRKAGVTVVMNLANDEASVKAFSGYEQSYYSTTRYIALNMGVDVASDEFKTKLAEGLRFFAANSGTYLVHCTEGKDRAGFVTALLESFMGASFEEVKADYMVTYDNYYGVTKDDARYDVIASSNIEKTLKNAFGVSDLNAADLSACARTYLSGIGLTDAEIEALKVNLAAPAADAAAAPVDTPVQTPAEPSAQIPVESSVQTPAETIAPAPAVSEYTVVWGDTLYKLALRFYGNGDLYPDLAKANKILNPNRIFVGQKLIVPAL